MTRQIASGMRTVPIAVLEERLRRLEGTVALLTRTVEALSREVAELTDAPPEPSEPARPPRRPGPAR